ncbi:MAG: DUF2817 domain-containing protein [Zetaproteobacteria bacterium]|nr:DUF2817 domain-containing protein [Zetaproteobacteria bacterium]
MSHCRDYFANSYTEARQKFLQSTTSAGYQTWHQQLPDHHGAAGEKLYMDFALCGNPKATTGFLMLSGTHGVEGFCGSALQSQLTDSGFFQEYTQECRILLVHAHNPYGFSWLRRVNESNIDLNRSYQDTSVTLLPEGYAQLQDVINPTQLRDDLSTPNDLQLEQYAHTHGPFQLQQAITSGQNVFPQGMYYTGTQPTWSQQVLQEVIPQAFTNVSEVGVLDIHTGLGKFGEALILHDYGHDTLSGQKMQQWFGAKQQSSAPSTSEVTPLVGTVGHGVTQMLPTTTVHSCTLEFGTVDLSQVLYILRADNWLHHHAALQDPQDPKWLHIKKQLKAAFYPGTDAWCTAVATQGQAVVQEMLNGLLQPSISR